MGLEEHIRMYKPRNFRETIVTFYTNPITITEKDAEKFLGFFNEGKLEERLSDYKTDDYNKKYLEENLNVWYIQDAILDYFAQKKHEPILSGETRLARPEDVWDDF